MRESVRLFNYHKTMKQKRITYGVYGMMEYQAVIKVGRSKMKVQFADGSVSAVGVSPATFSTTNLMVQTAIEMSEQFKRGLIKVVNTTELDKEVKIIRNPPKPAAPQEAEAPTPAPTIIKEAHSEASDEAEAPAEVEEVAEVEEAPIAEETTTDIAEPEAVEETEAPAEVSETKSATDMEFACNDDARDYLETNFGAVRSKLRTRADITAFASERGVNITFAV